MLRVVHAKDVPGQLCSLRGPSMSMWAPQIGYAVAVAAVVPGYPRIARVWVFDPGSEAISLWDSALMWAYGSAALPMTTKPERGAVVFADVREDGFVVRVLEGRYETWLCGDVDNHDRPSELRITGWIHGKVARRRARPLEP